MLPASLLDVEHRGPHVVPCFLTERDEPWVRSLVGVYQALCGAGRTLVDAEARIGQAAAALAGQSGRERAVRAMRLIVERDYVALAKPAAKPRDVRRSLYERASAEGHAARDAIVREVGAQMGLAGRDVLAAAFADFPDARVLELPPAPPCASALMERYNLALVQGLLRQALEVDVVVYEHVRAVVRFAKLKRLMCSFVEEGAGTRIVVSGPLALFGPTTKYGHALASFFPHVVSTNGWSLDAKCLIAGRAGRLRASSHDPLFRAHALPREVDSDLERQLTRDLLRSNSPWTVAREAAPLRSLTGLVFPDFTLSNGHARVHVEVVGFWTPEYLERKQRELRAVREPIVVCIEAAHQLPADAFGEHEVVSFHRKVDASAVLAAVERVAHRAGRFRPFA